MRQSALDARIRSDQCQRDGTLVSFCLAHEKKFSTTKYTTLTKELEIISPAFFASLEKRTFPPRQQIDHASGAARSSCCDFWSRTVLLIFLWFCCGLKSHASSSHFLLTNHFGDSEWFHLAMF